MEWHKINNVNDLPQCCGYEVMLTIENVYSKERTVIKAFTNYWEDGRFHFLSNEKEYCQNLYEAWLPIAWQPLPKPYMEEGGE